MKSISIYVCFLIVFLITSLNINAVPATPYPVSITQPDGSELTVLLHGDEFFNYKTTLDGYTLVPDTDGILTYAQTDIKGNLISTNIKATNIDIRSSIEKKYISTLKQNLDLSKTSQIRRASRLSQLNLTSGPQKAYPLNGTPKSLVILVNFSDLSFVTPNPKVAFTNLLNQKGYSTNGGTGSAKDYFQDSSDGVFNPQFDVVGPFTLPQPMAYYGANDQSGDDINPRQMVIDGCKLAAESGVDFSLYDTDKNGIVDNVFIYYAGYNEAEGGPKNSVWPHRWTLADLTTIFNGVSVYDYACTSELRSNTGANMCGVGTFCHEFGHVLGLPDLYNTSDQSIFTLSYWDIMDSGPYLNLGRTPPSYSSYERFFLNWLVPTELKVSGVYKLDTLSTTNKSYIISQNGNHNLNGSNPLPVEFFCLENRQKKGWDSYLPGHGMLVSHIFYSGSTWQQNTVNNNQAALGVNIVEADGTASVLTLSGDPFPGTSKISAYNPTLRNGTNIRKPLLNIQEINGIISFNFGSNIVLVQNLQPFVTVQGTPSDPQSVTVSGKKLKSAINIVFKVGQHYEMKIDTAKIWGKIINLQPTIDSLVANTTIQIRYNPTVPSFSEIHADTLILTTSSGDYANALMSGTSTRAVYVVPPIANNALGINYTSFVASWNTVFDATGYYLTAYNILNGESTFTEGFDNGLVAPIGWKITTTNTSTSNIYSGANPPSLLFSNSSDSVETETYELPVTKLSFYIHSLGGSNGGFLVDAQNSQSIWEKVDSIPITSTLNEKSKTYTFPETKGYDRFRFTYFKGIGSVTFDDVTVSFPKQLNYILRENWITSTMDTLTNLVPNTTYTFKVRASDKSIHYENITGFSNLVSVKTLGNVQSFINPDKSQIVYSTIDGVLIIKVPSNDLIINVYNSLGQQILNPIKSTSNVVEIRNLKRGQIYILKIGNSAIKLFL